MNKQIFISFLILVFINFLAGCSITSSELISIGKLSLDKEAIDGAALLNMDVVRFDKNGGKYVKTPAKISGKLKSNIYASIAIDQINEFRVSESKSTNLQDLNSRKIREVILLDDIMLTFDENGAEYNAESRKIVGKSKENKIVTIPEEKISEFFLESPKTIEKKNLNSETKLAQIILKTNSTVLTFDNNGGRFSAAKEAIIGFSIENTPLSVAPDSVLSLFVQRANIPRTILANVGLFSLIFVTVGVIVFAAIW